MWERTLQDLIRGLRANKKDEAKFIAKAVDEIRQEIKSDDMELKAGAVMKLTYVRGVLYWGLSILILLRSSTCWDTISAGPRFTSSKSCLRPERT